MSYYDPELRYLRHTPAGAEYVDQITAQESDRRARSMFRDLVLRMATPGARLFDFGAGPGIDARFFAERGFTVDAYDVDPRMRAFFTQHCRELIDSGQITLDGRSYREFLAHAAAGGGRAADLVISNFAPLNLVDDVHELFGKFSALTGPKGRILASVLSPWFIGDLRSRMWWRDAPRLWRDGEVFLPGPQAPYYRRLLRHFRTAAAPHFRMSRVFCSSNDPGEGRFAWLNAPTCRYVFLLFDKVVRP
jgi:SAM-dependent methyltransferase